MLVVEKQRMNSLFASVALLQFIAAAEVHQESIPIGGFDH